MFISINIGSCYSFNTGYNRSTGNSTSKLSRVNSVPSARSAIFPSPSPRLQAINRLEWTLNTLHAAGFPFSDLSPDLAFDYCYISGKLFPIISLSWVDESYDYNG